MHDFIRVLFVAVFESPRTVGAGRMDQGGYKSNSGNPRARHHEQCSAKRHTQRLQHVDAKHKGRETGGQRTIHVPSEH